MRATARGSIGPVFALSTLETREQGEGLLRYTPRRVRHINYNTPGDLVPPDVVARPRPEAAPLHRNRVVRVQVLQSTTFFKVPQSILLEEF